MKVNVNCGTRARLARVVGCWLLGCRPSRLRTNPTTINQQPTTNNQQPTTNNQQPTTNNQQPTTNNQQPTTIEQERRPCRRAAFHFPLVVEALWRRRLIIAPSPPGRAGWGINPRPRPRRSCSPLPCRHPRPRRHPPHPCPDRRLRPHQRRPVFRCCRHRHRPDHRQE